jgi:hypothetical protein
MALSDCARYAPPLPLYLFQSIPYLSVCASVGFFAPSLRSLWHVVVLSMYSPESISQQAMKKLERKHKMSYYNFRLHSDFLTQMMSKYDILTLGVVHARSEKKGLVSTLLIE